MEGKPRCACAGHGLDLLDAMYNISISGFGISASLEYFPVNSRCPEYLTPKISVKELISINNSISMKETATWLFAHQRAPGFAQINYTFPTSLT